MNKEVINEITFNRMALRDAFRISGMMTGIRTVKERIVNFFIARRGDTFIFTDEDKAPFSYFHKIIPIKHLNNEVSLRVLPADIDKALKGVREEEVLLKIIRDKGRTYIELNNREVECVLLDERNFTPVKREFNSIYTNQEPDFIKLIKSAGSTISKDTLAVDFGGHFLRIKNSHAYKSFPIKGDFEERSIDPTGFELLSRQIKNIKNSKTAVSVATNNNDLTLKFTYLFKDSSRFFEQLFHFKGINSSPKMRDYQPEKVFEFEVDADEINRALSEYKAEVKTLLLMSENNVLTIRPSKGFISTKKEKMERDEPEKSFPFDELLDEYTKKVAFRTVDQDNLARSKFIVDDLKAFFTGYNGTININILEFKLNDREYYMFECSNDGIQSYAVIIKEPNFDNIQKKIDEIIEKQKKLTYI